MRSIRLLSRTALPALAAGIAALTLVLTGAAPNPGSATTVNAKILAVDASAKTLRVEVAPKAGEAAPKDLNLGVNDQTKILKGNRPITISDLNPGDEIVLVYRDSSGSNVAVSIGVQDKSPS